MLDGIDIKIIDSHGVTFNLSACVMKAVDLLKIGESVDQIEAKVDEFGRNLRSFATLSTLDNLVRGGRMGPVRYRFGKLLGIKPVLIIGDDQVKAHDKARGVLKSRKKMYHHATARIKSSEPIRYFIAHADLEEEANELEKRFNTDYPKSTGGVFEIGALISVHTGRGALFILAYNE